jgi:hypothetical protein
MENYKVWITGTYHVEVHIEATSHAEAEDLVWDTYTKPMLEELVAEQGVDKILNVKADVPKVPLPEEFLPIPATISYDDVTWKSEHVSRRSLMGLLRKSNFFSSAEPSVQTTEIQALSSGHSWADKSGRIHTITF